MPQVDFYFGRQDEVRLIRTVLEQDATLVVGRQYRTREYDTIKSVIEYIQAREEGEPLFFIVSAAYSRSPLVLDVIHEGANRGKYFICQREGGPTVDLYCPVPYTRDDIEYIPQGMLAHHPTFWNPVTERNERAPPEQKRFFAGLVKEVRREAVAVRLRGRCYWVGPAAMKRRVEGAKLGPPEEVEKLLVSDSSLRFRNTAAQSRSK